MKKIVYILIVLIAVTGCNSKKNVSDIETNYSIKYNDDFYKVYMPYKKGVGNNYILNSNTVDYDLDKIEENLIQISTNEFSPDKYYYQEGQYLTKKILKELLDNKHLNKEKEKKVDGKKIKPQIVGGIIEKNFLNKDGDLKGVSLSIILNRYQSYDSNNNYVTLDQDEVEKKGKEVGISVIKYMREKLKLDNVPILIALYVEASPKSNVSGDYVYYGITENNDIEYKHINQKNYYMNNQNVKQVNSTSYNNFKKYEESIRDYDNSIYISGFGYFNDSKLSKLSILITKNHYSYGDLLYLNQLLSEKAIKYFKESKVVIKVKAINEIKSYIVKNAGETTTDIFIY